MSLIKEFPNTSSLLKHVLLIRNKIIQTFIHVHWYIHYYCPHLPIWKYHLSPRSNWLICWVCPLNVPCSPDTCKFHLEAFRAFYSRWHCLEMFWRTNLTTVSFDQNKTLFPYEKYTVPARKKQMLVPPPGLQGVLIKYTHNFLHT